jgi:hypothetical protein
MPVSAAEGRHLAEMDHDLLLVRPPATDPIMTCLGYRVAQAEPAEVETRSGTEAAFPRRGGAQLPSPAGDGPRSESTAMTSPAPFPSRQGGHALEARGRRLVALARYTAGAGSRWWRTPTLFSNRALRETARGPSPSDWWCPDTGARW